MAVLDITEDNTKTNISQGGALNVSSGSGVKSISNGTPTPLNIGEPQVP